ncbi:MAG: RhuM family protein [Motiliproteus sp.]
MEQPLDIYQNEDGSIQLPVQIKEDSLWLSLADMSLLFGVQKPAVSKHLSNIYQTGELNREATVSIMETVETEGHRQVKRKNKLYNLDAIISVGYRVNSSQATRFRIWATRILKQHLVKGFSLNQQRLEQNSAELEKAISLIKRTSAQATTLPQGQGLVDIISRYTHTFLWLQQYDEGLLQEPLGQTGGELSDLSIARLALAQLKANLMERGEASELFAAEHNSGLDAIWGALKQSAFGEQAYPSIESKAAHLLYFIVKNYPFTDGNKRSAALLFVDFINRNQRLFDQQGQPVINDIGLAALTLLIAESSPSEKQTVIRLVMNLLAPEVNDA